MKLSDIAAQLNLRPLTPELSADADVTRGFASDLLSDVLSGASPGSALVTVQVHMNVLAVAVHAELRAVVFASGREPERDVIAKAVEENIPLYVADAPAFEVVGKLYQMGLRG